MDAFIFNLFFLLFLFIHIRLSFGDDDDDKNNSSSYAAPPPLLRQIKPDFSPFKPSMAVIVGVLTTIFSVTFLILLYAKHCKRVNNNDLIYNHHHQASSVSARKNSGIDRTVIESLPIFRFASLRGQKDGLECAVCLNRFESTEVLRLLPKCKHAFHVECVDTWLDSHSTCPLCRYRVEPEDILLIQDPNQLLQQQQEHLDSEIESQTKSVPELKRVSGRHSSAGERGARSDLSSSSTLRKSVDSARVGKKSDQYVVGVGCFDRVRKDGLLLPDGLVTDRKSLDRRFEHRIVISAGSRWSDIQPSDLLYLRSEMIIDDNNNNNRGFSTSVKRLHEDFAAALQNSVIGNEDGRCGGCDGGSSVINSRSVSEITGLSRFSNGGEMSSSINRNYRQRQVGVVSRWLAWISSLSQPAVRSDATNTASASSSV